MIQDVIKCDCCGADIPEPRKELKLKTECYEHPHKGTIIDYLQYDLCRECAVDILLMLKRDSKFPEIEIAIRSCISALAAACDSTKTQEPRA